MKKTCTAQRSPCPIAGALDIIGDRWTMLVIRDLLVGKQRFDEFLSAPEGIATNILAQRLRWLVDNGLAVRQSDPDDGRKVTYHLTERGKGLKPLLLAMADWGMRTLDDVRIHPEYAKKLKKHP